MEKMFEMLKEATTLYEAAVWGDGPKTKGDAAIASIAASLIVLATARVEEVNRFATASEADATLLERLGALEEQVQKDDAAIRKLFATVGA